MQRKKRPVKFCPVCGEQILREKPNQILKATYCSNQCSIIGQTGSGNPNYKGKDLIKIECVVCHNLFTPKSLYTKRYICSIECKAKFTSILHKGKKISEGARLKLSIAHKAIQQRKLEQGLRVKSIPKKYPYKPGSERKYECKSCGLLTRGRKSKTCKFCRLIKSLRNRVGTCKTCNGFFIAKSMGIKGLVKHCSDKCYFDSRVKMSSGPNNPNWKGGIKTEHQRTRNHKSYKEWRTAVYKRDNYTCQDCGQIGGHLHAHHIKDFSKHKELRLDVNNGRTLCIDCHSKHHPSMNFSPKAKIRRKQQLKLF